LEDTSDISVFFIVPGQYNSSDIRNNRRAVVILFILKRGAGVSGAKEKKLSAIVASGFPKSRLILFVNRFWELPGRLRLFYGINF
jgi:hypothetical protein